MTTWVYKRWKYIAADLRSVWWHAWVSNDSNKITHIKNNDWSLSIYLISSGVKILDDVKKNMLEHFFIKSNNNREDSLYEFKNELKKYDPEFEYIIVFIDNWNEAAYRLIPSNAEKIEDFCSVWSWWYYADWIHLCKPDVELKELFQLCSRMDVNTSSDFNFISLKQ